MTPVDKSQQERFLREIVPAAASICPEYGLDPKRCIMEGAMASSCGRFTIGWNWWNLQGAGDAGFYTLVVPVRNGNSKTGGWGSIEQKVAKFSTPYAAVKAWCMAQGGR
jgi:hypothetical protein